MYANLVVVLLVVGVVVVVVMVFIVAAFKTWSWSRLTLLNGP